MYWLQRPPYIRWAAAALVVAAALYADLRPSTTVPHPFAAIDLFPGDAIDAGVVTWRMVPAGLLEPVDLTGHVVVPVAGGDPLLSSSVGSTSAVPEDWWAVPLAMPAEAPVGSDVLVVITEPAESIPGVVVASAATDPLSFEPTALVAVPPDAATRVAVAAATRSLVVLLAP